jgi:hypothetical protein
MIYIFEGAYANIIFIFIKSNSPHVGQDLLIHDISRTHSTTLHSR